MIRAWLWVAAAGAAFLGGIVFPAALEWPRLDVWAAGAGMIMAACIVKADRATARAMRDQGK